MKLFYKHFGEGKPLVILHGLMGMLDNWQGPAKRLAEDYSVYIVDARNHGHSPHDDEFTYQAMADDLLELVEELSLDEILLLGHSMGGKTAMKFAQQHPDYVEKLIVADIAPRNYPVHHQQILKALNSVDLNVVKSRKAAEAIMAEYIPEPGTRQFLLKNLYWIERGQLAWRINLEAITANIGLIGEGIYDRQFSKPTLFVRGETSDYIQDTDWPEIELGFTDAELVTIPGAGHWVHADAPEVFLDMVTDWLDR